MTAPPSSGSPTSPSCSTPPASVARRREGLARSRRPRQRDDFTHERQVMAVSPRVLIVANQTATSGALYDAVARRARQGPCTFTLLVPLSPRGLHRVVDPEDHG